MFQQQFEDALAEADEEVIARMFHPEKYWGGRRVMRRQ